MKRHCALLEGSGQDRVLGLESGRVQLVPREGLEGQGKIDGVIAFVVKFAVRIG